jgi:hypothetical protein
MQKSCAVALVLLTSLLVPLAAQAKTAKEVSDACNSKDPFMNGYCDGYIEALVVESGLIDSEHPVLSSSDNREVFRARLTGDYTLKEFEKAFVVYLAAHPEQESHLSSSVMFGAWLDHKMIRIARRADP